MKNYFLIIYFCFFIFKISLSNENIEIGPYLENLSLNEVIIKWKTNIKTKGKIVYYPQKQIFFSKKPKSIEIVEEKENIFHQIKILNLKENTIYCYKIITEKGDLKINTFKTPFSKCNSFSFVVYGETDPLIQSCLINSFKNKNNSFILYTENLSFYKNENFLKKYFFNLLKNIIKEKSIFVCPENFEKEENISYSNYFNFPFDKKGYSFNYGNAHFIVLNSNSEWEKESSEFQWLEQDLKQSTNFQWKIVLLNQSPFIFSSQDSNLKIKNNLCSLFYQYGIDLVFSGNHFYSCSYPIRQGNSDDKYATIFVTTANKNEKKFNIEFQPIGTRLVKSIPHYCFVSIQKNKLILEAIDANENVFDIFTIDKKNDWLKQKYLFSAMTQFNIEKLNLIRPQIQIPCLSPDEKEQTIKIKVNTNFPEICKGQIFWEMDENYSIIPQKINFEVKKEQPFEKEFQLKILSAYLYPTPIIQTFISHEKITSKVEKALLIRKKVFCSNTKEKIQLDGFLNEKLWTEKKPRTDFVVITGDLSYKRKTDFYLTYDDENLYIGVNCEEKDVEKLLYNAIAQDDQRVWKDDCIEVLINIPSNEKKYFQFVVNCLGIQFDSKNGNIDWNGNWQSYAVISNFGWSVEFVIPFKNLETSTPQNGEVWNFNISRNSTPQNIYTQWSPSYTHIEEVSLLGELVFE